MQEIVVLCPANDLVQACHTFLQDIRKQVKIFGSGIEEIGLVL